jgi:hypothetical protein
VDAHEEALNPYSTVDDPHHVERAPRHRISDVVTGDLAKQQNASAPVRPGGRVMEEFSADVVEHDVDSGRAEVIESSWQILGGIVDRGVDPALVGQPARFSCEPHTPTTRQPRMRPICAAMEPTDPAVPETTSVWRGCG